MSMATASATLSSATFAAATVAKSRPRSIKVHYISGLNSFDGLEARSTLAALGLPVCTHQCFAKVVSSLKAPSNGRRGGGALSSTCSVAAEIFRIAAIMNGLVLVGVAVGFLLLRLETSLEEAE